MRSAIIDGRAQAVFIDGIEYLALIHGMADLMACLHLLDRVARAFHSAIHVPLNAALMDEGEYAYLAGAFQHGTAA